MCEVGREPGEHISFYLFVFMRGVNVALAVEMAPLSVEVWWAVFLFVIGVESGDGSMSRVPVGLNWEMWGVRCSITRFWRVDRG